jgi:hypothetical protein
MQSVPITTKVVCLNPPCGEVYSVQHYVIKFVSDLRQVGGLLRVLQFLPSKTDTQGGFKHTTLVVIGTDCIDSYKSNFNTIMTTMAPDFQMKEKLVFTVWHHN